VKTRSFLSARAFRLVLRAALLAWFLPRSPGLLQNSLPSQSLLRRLPLPEPDTYWLTIDDGPCRHDTEALLRVLAAHGARASFFAIGQRVERYPELARLILKEGHTLENHTYSHRSATFWLEPSCLIRSEIMRCTQAIHDATGLRPRFFRAPAGRWNHAVWKAAVRDGLTPVGWSARAADSMPCSNLLRAMSGLAARVKAGDIVLFHQGGHRGRAAALDWFLLQTDRAGLRADLPII
jgi:peptidoglycan/xylan/chitin deacetylase (PgdA/CDA1 family)